MKVTDFYLEALRANAFLLNAWTLSVFTTILEEEGYWLTDPYPYRVVRKDNKAFFVKLNGSLEELEGIEGNQPLLALDHPLDLMPGDLINVVSKVETTASEAFLNAAVLCYPFGKKFDYKPGAWDASFVEQMAEKHMVSDPAVGETVGDDVLTVAKLKVASKVLLALTALNAYFVPTASPRNITFNPELIKKRDEGMAELKRLGKANDPIEIAKLEKELEKMDRAWCNDYGSTFFTEDKEFNNSRKKQYIHVGYEKDFLDDSKGNYVGKSLTEGMQAEDFHIFVNSSREGSYNRGQLTMLGGAGVKNAIRATMNSRVIDGFCGTELGLMTDVKAEDRKDLLGFYILNKGKMPTEITEDNFPSFVNKRVALASAGFCLSKFTDTCSVCIGKTGASRPNALPLNISDISSANMYTFMKKMHVSSIVLVKLDLARSLMR